MQQKQAKLVLMLSVSMLLGTSEAASSLDILRTDLLSEQRKIETVLLPGKRKKVEACAGDWCQVVVLRPKSHDDSKAWDAIFLMFFYFDANDEYRARRSDHAAFLLEPYKEKCRGHGTDQRRVAACALHELQREFGFKYRRAQYDAGGRCESNFMTHPPYFSRIGRCAPDRG